MKKKLSALLSLLLVFSFLFSSASVSAVYVTGNTVVGSSVTDSEIHQLGDGLVYNEFTYTDSRGIVQTCFTMEFNPKASDFRSYIYHTKASYGYTITADAENATKEGLDVYAAVNGDFFTMNDSAYFQYGAPITMYATEGKLMSAVLNTGSDWKLAIAEDGTADVMESTLKYSLVIGDTDYSSQWKYINKRPKALEDKIYYFDADCNETNPVTSENEILVTYESGELSAGDTLIGTVASVKNSGGSKLEGKNFVLVSNSNVDISGVKVGDKVTITVSEERADSKEAIESAAHLITARYVLVHDGENRWEKGLINDPGMTDIYAQRSVYGIKPDGSIVYMVCDGRKVKGSGANGFNFTQIADMMIELGCSEVINFDGGGSTAVVIGEGDGKFNYEFIGESTGRAVCNALLIVRDPNAEALPEKEYTPIVDKENTELRNVAINKKYNVTWNGVNVPSYLNTASGDEYSTKMTNGKYRPAVEDADVSAAFPGAGANVTYVIDLEKARDDIRAVTMKGVSNYNNRGFKEDNVIVYVSDDKINWTKSVDHELIKTATSVNGVYEYCAKFKESQSGRYVKLIIGTPEYVLQLDEIEVNAMVDKDEPIEEPAEDPNAPKPADPIPSYAENVAAGKKYVVYAKGAPVESYYNAGLTADNDTYKLTDGKLGTAGSWSDGFTVGFISGTGQQVDIVVDLGEVVKDIEFAQIQNMINSGSFGAATLGTLSYSLDGETFTEGAVNKGTEQVENTFYNHLTLQFKQKVEARYIKISVTAPKYLFGMGEVRIFSTTPKAEPEFEDGDINGDGEIDSADAGAALKYDAGMLDLTEEQIALGDVNGDGELDSSDANLIFKYDAGMITEFTK